MMSLERSPDGSGPACRSCGSHVSEDFVRVFGDAGGEVHACIECSTRIALQKGAGAMEGYERRVDRELSPHRGQRRDSPNPVATGGSS